MFKNRSDSSIFFMFTGGMLFCSQWVSKYNSERKLCLSVVGKVSFLISLYAQKADSLQPTVSNVFVEVTLSTFDSNLPFFLVIRLLISIALYNWLISKTRRAITWNNDDQIRRSMFASSGRNELTHPPVQNYRYFVDDIFESIVMNETFYNLIRVSLKTAPKF